MRLSRRRLAAFLLLSAAGLGLAGWFLVPDTARVLRIVDGDTVEVLRRGRRTTVRLLGVDTPETVHPRIPDQFFGPEATAYTKRLLTGQTVRLTYPPRHERHDRYGRLLAFLERRSDHLDVNLEIVRQGYGRAYTKYPFRGLERFVAAQREAQAARRGLWAPGAVAPPETFAP
ncbi:MAG: thermonuclease family protein [Fimbriimonadaceae bacterium]|nr:thermonuclease family protein [Fimbriimonadaceae bacterium]